MDVTIIHIGGTIKVCDFDDFDPPRPWVRLRYPNGGGVWAFALAHGGIESKRGTLPEWSISDPDLETLRTLARGIGISFRSVPFARAQQQRPGKPRKPVPQKQLELFK